MEQHLRAVRPQDVVSAAIGERVLRLRKEEKHWSQETLAHFVGVSRETIRRVEAGIGFPEGETFIRLSVALGVNPSDLLPEDYAEIFDPGRRSLERLGQRLTAAEAQAEGSIERRAGAASNSRSSASSKARKLATPASDAGKKLVASDAKLQRKLPAKAGKKRGKDEGLVISDWASGRLPAGSLQSRISDAA